MYSSKLTSREGGADLKRQIPAVSLNLVVSVYFDRLVLIGRSDLYQTAARDQTKRLSPLPLPSIDKKIYRSVGEREMIKIRKERRTWVKLLSIFTNPSIQLLSSIAIIYLFNFSGKINL